MIPIVPFQHHYLNEAAPPASPRHLGICEALVLGSYDKGVTPYRSRVSASVCHIQDVSTLPRSDTLIEHPTAEIWSTRAYLRLIETHH
jgi:hypothetical protein